MARLIPQKNVEDMTWDGVVYLNQIMDHKIGTQQRKRVPFTYGKFVGEKYVLLFV